MAVIASSLWGASSFAHPGGTDRFGCHTDSSTGIYHCHGDRTTGPGDFVLGVEGALEAGRVLWNDEQAWIGYQLGGYIQQDATTLALAGFTFHYFAFHPRVVTYIDWSLGVGFVDHYDGPALVVRGSGGVKIGIFGEAAAKQSIHLKVGPFAELIKDGLDAEPLGVAAAVGFAF